MTIHKANPNSSYSTRYQHTSLCNARGVVTGSGSGSVFMIATSDDEVTCKRCVKVMQSSSAPASTEVSK